VAHYLGDLADYNFKLIHKPGKLNKADHLLQRPDYDEGKEDNEDVLVLPERLFTQALTILDVEQQIYDVQEGEGVKKIQEWAKCYPLQSVNHHWFHGSRPVVATDPEGKRNILHLYHDHEAARHLGIVNTFKAVAKEYWWPDMKHFVVQYVKGCAVCQSTKPNTTRPRAPLFPITEGSPKCPFQVIGWDLIMDLPKSQTFDSVLTIVNQGCTKAAIFIPCTKEVNVEGVVELYAQKVFPHYRIPQKIISDRDPRFTAKFARAVCSKLNNAQNISTAYHPQTDG
jgi:Integrase zinc binding domain